MFRLPSITLQIRGHRLAGRLAFTVLFVAAILMGAAAGLMFVYSTDLPEIRALEDYRPNVVTELYADDGQQIGNFAMQLAGGLFLDRSDRSFRRKMQETLLAIQIERNYPKQQIFTMYANQVYL